MPLEFSEENPHFPWWASTAALHRWSKLIKPMLNEGVNSFDVPELSHSRHHLVFVYGTLKRNKYAHSRLKNSPLISTAITKAPSFLLWQTKGGHAFPVMLIKDKDETGAKHVQGEVYIVDVPTLKSLDRFEQNGDLYRRIKIRVTCTGDHRGKELSAWVYIGFKGVWKPEIDEGKMRICPAFKPKKDPNISYYTFIQ